jgi:hypothetical protein
MFDARWYNVTCETCGTLFLRRLSPWHPAHAALPGTVAVKIPVPWEAVSVVRATAGEF